MERTREDVKRLAKTLLEAKGGKEALTRVLARYKATKIAEVEDIDLGVFFDLLSAEYERIFLEKRPLKKFERFKYGRIWSAVEVEKKGKGGKSVREPLRPLLDVEIEMRMFLLFEQGQNPIGGLSRYEHAVLGMQLIWPETSRKPFKINPYSKRMLTAFCQHKFIALAGHASGSKTYTPAAWLIWNYLCDPWNTKGLVTSTTLKDSKGRIWGDIEEFWNAADDYFISIGAGKAPGKLVSSNGTIRYSLNGEETDKAGITLIAGDKSEAAKSEAKVKGFKRTRFIFVVDEMTDLSENLISSAKGNLASNPYFQMIGIGNPASYYDPLGKFCEPLEGYSSVNESIFEWQGKEAYVLRFDGKTSPNVLAGRNIYPGLLGFDTYEEKKRKLGENSPIFYQMYRGFWCPTGSIEAIYSEQEIVSNGADRQAGHGWSWLEPPAIVCGFDPSFTHKGDRASAYFSAVGLNQDRVPTFCFLEYLILEMNVNNPLPKEIQIIRQLASAMEKRGVKVKDLGVDISGSSPFGVLVSQEMGDAFTRVQFGGSPSEMAVSKLDPRPAKEVYDLMVAELWHVGKELISTGQLKGLHPDMIKEMVARTYGTKGKKIWVEPKPEMKKRTGFSPDIADSGFISLLMARKNYGLTSGARAKASTEPRNPNSINNWNDFAMRTSDYSLMAGGDFHYGV